MRTTKTTKTTAAITTKTDARPRPACRCAGAPPPVASAARASETRSSMSESAQTRSNCDEIELRAVGDEQRAVRALHHRALDRAARGVRVRHAVRARAARADERLVRLEAADERRACRRRTRRPRASRSRRGTGSRGSARSCPSARATGRQLVTTVRCRLRAASACGEQARRRPAIDHQRVAGLDQRRRCRADERRAPPRARGCACRCPARRSASGSRRRRRCA